MTEFVPRFQYEIRFNHILDFNDHYKALLAPFVKLTSRIRIEKEGKLDQHVVMEFETGRYDVLVGWDRMVYIGVGPISTYELAGSPIAEPFFNIFKQIKNLPAFSSTSSHILYLVYVNASSSGSKDEEIVSTFKKQYFSSKLDELVAPIDDVNFTINQRTSSDEIALTVGPYLGTGDLKKRQLRTDFEHATSKGTMVEFQNVQKQSDVSYSNFSKLLIQSLQIIQKACQR